MIVGHSLNGCKHHGVGVHASRVVTADGSTGDDRHRVVMIHRDRGLTIRQIAYLTGIPRGTVGDIVKRDRGVTPGPSPFWQLCDF